MGPKKDEKYLELSEQLSTLLDEVKLVKTSMITKDDLDQALQRVCKEYKDLLVEKDRQISELNDRLAVQNGAIETIKKEQNRAEQYSRRKSVRIHDVERKAGETAEDCLRAVNSIIQKQELDIPDAVIDRAHRVGIGKKGKPPAIIAKFTTWRHRTILYRARQNVLKDMGYRITLDITKSNIEMMDALREEIKENDISTVDYIFCDVNCQPTIKFHSGKYNRFNTYGEGMRLLGLADEGDIGG